jgi:hypothetical protein
MLGEDGMSRFYRDDPARNYDEIRLVQTDYLWLTRRINFNGRAIMPEARGG